MATAPKKTAAPKAAAPAAAAKKAPVKKAAATKAPAPKAGAGQTAINVAGATGRISQVIGEDESGHAVTRKVCMNATFPNAEFPQLTVVTHPLVQHKLTWLRHEDTNTEQFRNLLREVGRQFAARVLAALPCNIYMTRRSFGDHQVRVAIGRRVVKALRLDEAGASAVRGGGGRQRHGVLHSMEGRVASDLKQG